MIPFNIPPYTSNELEYLSKAIESHKICGDGQFTKKCSEILKAKFPTKAIKLTTSCTSALEIAAILCNIQPGDEVILPSFTFCSTADCVVQRGGILVFVDIRPDTMNINENLIEAAITSKTKAIIAVHYAGVGCEMNTICTIAKKHNLFVIEDAAQAVNAFYKGKPLGTIGDAGCYSFHETKNYSMGEGGAISVNRSEWVEKTEIIREKGTNRSKFLRGEIDKYTWVDYGSSYLPSELNAAYLLPQLEIMEEINKNRIDSWNKYYSCLSDLAKDKRIELPVILEGCIHNAHMFYIKTENLEIRTKLISFLKQNEITAPFHYIPLHTSPAGRKFGRFNGTDTFTTKESERLLRLPLYYNLKEADLALVCDKIHDFFKR